MSIKVVHICKIVPDLHLVLDTACENFFLIKVTRVEYLDCLLKFTINRYRGRSI